MTKYFISFAYTVADKPCFGNIIDNANLSTYEGIVAAQEKLRSTISLRFKISIDSFSIINFIEIK